MYIYIYIYIYIYWIYHCLGKIQFPWSPQHPNHPKETADLKSYL